MPAALALALVAIRTHKPAFFASAAAAGFALAVVHPTYAIFLWIPFVGFLLVRFLWTRRDLRAGLAALGALSVPAALFMLWLIPIAADTVSVSPGREEVRRAFEQYPGQLDVRSDTSYSLAAEVFTRSGPVAVAALLLIPLAAFASRRRWAAFVAGGSLAVFLVMLVPLLFTALSDLVSISQARRAAGFLPFAFATTVAFVPVALGSGFPWSAGCRSSPYPSSWVLWPRCAWRSRAWPRLTRYPPRPSPGTAS